MLSFCSFFFFEYFFYFHFVFHFFTYVTFTFCFTFFFTCYFHFLLVNFIISLFPQLIHIYHHFFCYFLNTFSFFLHFMLVLPPCLTHPANKPLFDPHLLLQLPSIPAPLGLNFFLSPSFTFMSRAAVLLWTGTDPSLSLELLDYLSFLLYPFLLSYSSLLSFLLSYSSLLSFILIFTIFLCLYFFFFLFLHFIFFSLCRIHILIYLLSLTFTIFFILFFFVFLFNVYNPPLFVLHFVYYLLFSFNLFS
ncbi:unnamed protein product [Acanthosepion pharaonis]|uniref:Uncharacterized protein n=1 Tax=Acanthosepion pharaonis TaxID=158019 RepID=A0A812EFE4_ACAPH|nr:unnamed protein product [Sepia pharaonis]